MKEIARDKVQEWIGENFCGGEMEQEKCLIVPGGVILRDEKGGEMLIWWDFLEEKINYKIREKGVR